MSLLSSLLDKLLEISQTTSWLTTTLTKGDHQSLQSNINFTPSLGCYYLSFCPQHNPAYQLAKMLFHRFQVRTPQPWNYHSSPTPYPHDLDSATIFTHTHLNLRTQAAGNQLRKFVTTLYAQEIAVGGPYRTWIIEPTNPLWGQDVDIVVNSRVDRLLNQMKSTVPPLQNYLVEAALHQQTSVYYPPGTSQAIHAMHNPKYLPVRCDWAFATEYLCRLHHQDFLGDPHLITECYQLLNRQTLSKIQELPCFLDNLQANTPQWASSPFLTIAASTSALIAAKTFFDRQKSHTTYRNFRVKVPAHIQNLQHPALLPFTTNHPHDCTISKTHPEWLFLESLAKTADRLAGQPHQLLLWLVAGNTLAWKGYTMHDDIVDTTTHHPTKICISRQQTLQSLTCFSKAISLVTPSHQPTLLKFTNTCFQNMEKSYQIDVQITQNMPTNFDWELHAFQKSCGLLIAPTIWLTSQPALISDAQLVEAAKPIIIARQLLDDVHDFSADYTAHRQTLVTFTAAKHQPHHTNTTSQLSPKVVAPLAIPPTMKRIQQHLDQATTRLTAMPSPVWELFQTEVLRLQAIVANYQLEKDFFNSQTAKPTLLAHTTANQPLTKEYSPEVIGALKS